MVFLLKLDMMRSLKDDQYILLQCALTQRSVHPTLLHLLRWMKAMQTQQKDYFERLYQLQQQHYEELSARQLLMEQMVQCIYDYYVSQGHFDPCLLSWPPPE